MLLHVLLEESEGRERALLLESLDLEADRLLRYKHALVRWELLRRQCREEEARLRLVLESDADAEREGLVAAFWAEIRATVVATERLSHLAANAQMQTHALLQLQEERWMSTLWVEREHLVHQARAVVQQVRNETMLTAETAPPGPAQPCPGTMGRLVPAATPSSTAPW